MFESFTFSLFPQYSIFRIRTLKLTRVQLLSIFLLHLNNFLASCSTPYLSFPSLTTVLGSCLNPLISFSQAFPFLHISPLALPLLSLIIFLLMFDPFPFFSFFHNFSLLIIGVFPSFLTFTVFLVSYTILHAYTPRHTNWLTLHPISPLLTTTHHLQPQSFIIIL